MNPTEVDEVKLKTAASRILADCRTHLLQTHPFIGTIAMGMNIIPVRDQRMPTACTDGINVFFDIEFLSKLTDAEKTFVLAHEFWHNVLMHFTRQQNRIASIFNVATDLEVNQLLIKEGMTCPKEVLLPKKFNFPPDLSAENYYEMLLKKTSFFKNSMRQGQSNKSNSQSGKDNGQSENGNDENEINDLTDELETGSSYSKQQRDVMHKKKRGIHISKEISDELTKNSNSKDKYGALGNDSDFNPESNKNGKNHEKTEKIREMIVAAAQQIERQRGELPNYAKAIVDKLLTPKIPWKELLASSVTSSIANKTNWNQPNRRFAYTGMYLPSHKGEMIKLAIGIDTSGSTMGFLKRFLSEIVGIVKSFDSYDLHIIQCDTKVQKYDNFNDEENPLNSIDDFNFEGLGGTVLKPIFNYIKDNDLDVDKILVFTDGYTEKFTESDSPNQSVCWVLPEGSSIENLGFGEKIFIPDEND